MQAIILAALLMASQLYAQQQTQNPAITRHDTIHTNPDQQAGQLFVEAESFAEKGGWKTDQQFIDQMGSSYLIAHGMGVPVSDAKGTGTIPHFCERKATGCYFGRHWK